MKTLNAKVQPSAELMASSWSGTQYMRDISDEEHNMNDIIGVMLRGQNLDLEVLVTFNRLNSTFYENYNSSIVSDLLIVTSPWKRLTPQGMVRVRNLRKFYELKMPQEVRELRIKIMSGQPPDTIPDGINLGIREHIQHPQLDPDVLLMYDLDNIHVSSVKKTKADVDLKTGDDFVSTHSYVEEALTNAGFNLVMEEKNRDYRKYDVTFQGLPLSSLNAEDSEGMDAVSDAIELAIGTLGWEINPLTFPNMARTGGLTWTAGGGSCNMRVSSLKSTIEFFRA